MHDLWSTDFFFLSRYEALENTNEDNSRMIGCVREFVKCWRWTRQENGKQK